MTTANMCMLPWISVEVTSTGSYRPCCVYKDEIPGLQVQAGHSIADAQHSEYMVNLRQQFLNGEKPSGCISCWQEESVPGRSSKRKSTFAKLKNMTVNYSEDGVAPIFLDLKLGNICNLKCRICGSWSSSKWVQEEIATLPMAGKLPLERLRLGQWPRNSSQIWWEGLEGALPHIEYLEFTGGEPFLINEHFDILEELVKRGYASKIDLHYNTNGTIWPDRGVELWPHFKHVQIAFSIDDTKERFEYQRFGATWDNVEETIQNAINLPGNISLQVCTTFNIQNSYYWPETANWITSVGIENVHLNLLHNPAQFNLRNLSPSVKLAFKEKMQTPTRFGNRIDSVIGFMMLDGVDKTKELLAKLAINDKYRNQDFAKCHPEVARLLNE